MDTDPITGGCYCGAIRFAAEGQARDSGNCHCSNCRRAVGAPSVAWITVPRPGFRYVQGEPRRFRTDTQAWRTFCGTCGTSLTFESDTRPGELDITTGSLDHPEAFPPREDSFPEERVPWVPLVAPG